MEITFFMTSLNYQNYGAVTKQSLRQVQKTPQSS